MDLAPIFEALPYALRGVSTPGLPFNAVGQIVLPPQLPISVATALQAVCEPCVLYRALDTSLRHNEPDGLLAQALFSAVRESLRSFLALTSEIEALSSQPHFTLAQAQSLLQAPCVYLRLFTAVLRQCARPGAHILSVVWEFTHHGDPLVAGYAQQLFTTVHGPFERMRREWENLGSLQLDQFGEFYVAEGGAGDAPALVAANVPPGVLGADEVERSYQRGLAMHFIRKVCGNLEYVGTGRSFAQIADHSRRLLVEDNRLMLHLRGLRDYMLLANGNFVDALFRNDPAGFLMSPVPAVGSHQASEFFLAAIDDAKQVREDPMVTKALDAKILGIDSALRGRPRRPAETRVWEAFIGKYHIDAAPLRRVVDAAAIRLYERCFVTLWRVRLAVHGLDRAAGHLRWWVRHAADPEPDRRLVFRLHAKMSQVFLRLQMHLYYDIIEKEWLTLATAVHNPRTLTTAHIKHAHEAYLAAIVAAAAEPAQFRAIDAATRQVLALEALALALDQGYSDLDTVRQELLYLQTEFTSTTMELMY